MGSVCRMRQVRVLSPVPPRSNLETVHTLLTRMQGSHGQISHWQGLLVMRGAQVQALSVRAIDIRKREADALRQRIEREVGGASRPKHAKNRVTLSHRPRPRGGCAPLPPAQHPHRCKSLICGWGAGRLATLTESVATSCARIVSANQAFSAAELRAFQEVWGKP